MISQSTRIGIAAMSALAEAHGSDAPALTARQIAARRGVPAPFVAKVLTTLARRDLVRGTRGPGGGFVLVRAPGTIALQEIAACFEPVKREAQCPLGRGRQCDARQPCPLHVPFLKVHQAEAAFLTSTTLGGFSASAPAGVRKPPRKRTR
jgi:Rrf2 family transcriptional regulator, iron-sulfur cluster assembly transcription factor